MEGFEPPKAEPESAVLPLHYIPFLKSFGRIRKSSILCQPLVEIQKGPTTTPTLPRIEGNVKASTEH